MPIYEFECRKCKAHLEVFQKINDKPPVKCRKCGGRLEKQVSASAIQFKGTGWYITDYAKSGSNSPKSTGGAEPKAKTESTTKSETKSESKPAATTSTSTSGDSNK